MEIEHKHKFTVRKKGTKERFCECGMSRIYYEFSLKRFPAAKTECTAKIVCPCTKKECPLHDQSACGQRDWCDNNGDPSEYERCPIPKKRKAKTGT